MITNSKLTVYHKDFDEINRVEIWKRRNYDNIWWFGGKGTKTNLGYEDANNIQIRIPYEKNPNLNVKDFSMGDILVKGELDFDIETQQNLLEYDVYNITAINNNETGKNTHIHISGK